MKNKNFQNKLLCLAGLLMILCLAGCSFEIYDIANIPDQATAWTPLYINAYAEYSGYSYDDPPVYWSIKDAGTTKAIKYSEYLLFAMAPGTVVVSATAGKGEEKFTKNFTITVHPAPEEIHSVGTELASHTANTANNPVLLKPSLDLEIHWLNLLNMLIVADRYVNLDLTESTGTHIPALSDRLFISDILHNKNALSIVLPEGITSIGAYAFFYYKGLTSVRMGNNVSVIGDSAFSNCSRLASVTIPNSVTSIGTSAFRNCTGLTSVSIPNSVTSIGNSAFENCSSLASVIIPDSVTNIGSNVFYNCSNLAAIDVAPGNTMYSSIDGILYDKTGTSLIRFPMGKTEIIVTIPHTVTSIGNNAFSNCSSLTSVSIPNSVTSIGNSAFRGCRSLASIIIPDSVTSIGDSAFSYCSKLTSVIIGNTVEAIGKAAFDECSKLATVTFNGTIAQSGFDDKAFPGDLRVKYFANSGGPGTYTNKSGSSRWSKE